MKKLKLSFADSLAFLRGGFGETVRTTALAMVGLILLSFVFSMLLPQQADGVVEYYSQMLQQNITTVESSSTLFTALLFNNCYAMLIAVSYGLFPFIRLPALTLGINGSILGLFAGYSMRHGMTLLQYLLGILPHGIFELFALILAVTLGLVLCDTITASLRKHTRGIIGPMIARTGQIYFFWILPLLILAALIETYVTPIIFGWVL